MARAQKQSGRPGPELKRLSKVFKALSNPNRLQLFLNLLDESRLDLAKGRDPDATTVGEVMTPDPIRVDASTSVVRSSWRTKTAGMRSPTRN